MSSTSSEEERRIWGGQRRPLDTIVELDVADHEDLLEAESLEIGARGLSLCAAYMPPVGLRMQCRFDSPQGMPVSASCEVRWTDANGPDVCKFGLEFVEMDTRSHTVLRTMLDDGVANDTTALAACMEGAFDLDDPITFSRDLPGGAVPGQLPVSTGACDAAASGEHLDAARVAGELRIHGMAAPIGVGICQGSGDLTLVQQELDVFRPGRGVELSAEGVKDVVGRIANVQVIQAKDGTPILQLGILRDAPTEPADTLSEADGGQRAPTGVSSGDCAASRLAAAAAEDVAPMGQGTVARTGGWRELDVSTDLPGEFEATSLVLQTEEEAVLSEVSDVSPVLHGVEADASTAEDVPGVESEGRGRWSLLVSGLVRLLHNCWAWVMAQPWRERAQAVLSVLRRGAGSEKPQTPHGAGDTVNSRVDCAEFEAEVSPELPGPVDGSVADAGDASSRLGEVYSRLRAGLADLAEHVWRFFGHFRARRQARRARTRGTAAGRRAAQRALAQRALFHRRLALGACVLTVVSLLTFAFSDGAEQESLVTPHTSGGAAGPLGESEAEEPSAGATAAERPHASREAGAIHHDGDCAFGEIPSAQTYPFALDGAVERLECTSLGEGRGFRVRVHGSRTLQRARSIQRDPAVKSAQFKNHGSYAELTVRFEPGISSAYRVEASGAGLSVSIAAS